VVAPNEQTGGPEGGIEGRPPGLDSEGSKLEQGFQRILLEDLTDAQLANVVKVAQEELRRRHNGD